MPEPVLPDAAELTPQADLGPRDLSPVTTAVFFDQEYFCRRTAGEMPWPEVGVGVALAGATFPYVLAFGALLIGGPIAVLSGEVGVVDLPGVVAGGVAMLAGLLIVGGAAFMITGVVAAVTLPLVGLVITLLGVRGRMTPLACFAGGVVTFVVCSPVWIHFNPMESWDSLLAVVLFPGLATPFGQFGSGYLAMNNESIPWVGRVLRHRANRPAQPMRFSLWQVLVLMTIVSVAFAALQLTGLLRPHVFAAIFLWAAYQWLPLWATIKLVDWRQRKLVERMTGGDEEGST